MHVRLGNQRSWISVMMRPTLMDRKVEDKPWA
jgi:hypothetical protein